MLNHITNTKRDQLAEMCIAETETAVDTIDALCTSTGQLTC